MNKEILVVAELCSLNGSGPSALNCYRLVNELARSGQYNIDLITSDCAPPLENVRLHHVAQWVLPFNGIKQTEDKFISRFSSHPGPGSWAVRARRYCRNLSRLRKYDCVIAWSNPIGSLYAALGAKKSIPLIWRTGDPYPPCLYPRYRLKGEWHEVKTPTCTQALHWLHQIKSRISAVVSPSKIQNDWFREKASLSDASFHVWPHIGGEANPPKEMEKPPESIFNIGYFGRLSANRCPSPFLEVLDNINQGETKVRLNVFGTIHEHWKQEIAKREAKGVVKSFGMVGFQESLTIMCRQDALLLIEAEFETGIFTPSKLADYAWTGRPVIAMSREGGAVHEYMGRNHPGVTGFSKPMIAGALYELVEKRCPDINLRYRIPSACFAPTSVIAKLRETIEQVTSDEEY